MKDRTNYRKYSLDEFSQELKNSVEYFIANMEKLDINNLSFPEWYETFGAWLEVGTSMEEISYK